MKDKRLSPQTLVGTTWVGKDGHTYKLRRGEGAQNLTITISTFIGFGGRHYYGRIRGDRPSIYDCDENSYLFCGGYGPDAPRLSGWGEFNAERMLTKVEVDMDGQSIGPLGSMTGRFNIARDAFIASLNCVLLNFRDTQTRHWSIVFDGCGDDLYESCYPQDAEESPWCLEDLKDQDRLLKLCGGWDA